MFGSEQSNWDVAVLGSGPAGLAIAHACSIRELRVVVVASEPVAPWANSYGCWEGGARGLGLEGCIQSKFERPVVTSGDGRSHELKAAYLRLDTVRLQRALTERCRTSAVHLQKGSVSRLEHSSSHTTAFIDTGAVVKARLVIDATGARSTLSQRSRTAPTGYQTAYGVWLRVAPNQVPAHMTLMDWRPVSAPAQLPSFLYAIPESSDRLFLQETCLATQEPVAFEILEQRLRERLAQLGLEGAEQTGIERCLIPMGSGLPLPGQEVLPFGAAAGLIHPATGYQLTRSLRAAPLVADVIAATIRQSRRETIDQALGVLWSKQSRHAFAMYQMGLEVILSMNPAQLRVFMARFFLLPTPLWLSFMEGTLPARDIASAMWRVFMHSPTSLRLQLLQRGALSGSRALISAIA